MNRELRIVYMGTPEFAVEPLRAIIDAGYNVVAVITVPDKPAGRGQILHVSAVKEFALSKNIPVLQPVNLKDPGFIAELKSYDANLQVVVAFRMLPEVVWQMPEYGTLNLHASLLPQYRGAAPINHAIINGETETGLTTFFIEKEIDTGNIILSKIITINPADDAGTLHERLMYAGGELMLETLELIKNDKVQATNQSSIILTGRELKPAPKIFKNDCKLDWDYKSEEIHNKVRGLSPFPCAFSNLVTDNGSIRQVKIYKTSFQILVTNKEPGSIVRDRKDAFSVVSADGLVFIEELQMEGKKRMKSPEFLRGVNLTEQYHFE
ncbi:MAG: methionyl-tRNA formyltransferase [Bacteroidales bacterium]